MSVAGEPMMRSMGLAESPSMRSASGTPIVVRSVNFTDWANEKLPRLKLLRAALVMFAVLAPENSNSVGCTLSTVRRVRLALPDHVMLL